MPVRCWVYVDGFNFYHGATVRTQHKWVDLLRLSENLRRYDQIQRIKYFTALVERRTDDPDQRRRQQTYWRALRTIPCLEIIEGRFTRWPKHLPLWTSVQQLEDLERKGCNVVGVRPLRVEVARSEEKGSDVNLAAHLVHDANQTDPDKTFEAALVLSTDADLAEAIGLVTTKVGKPVWVCKPNPSAKTSELQKAATGIFDLKTSVLQASLFPPSLTDARGPFTKPSTW